MVYAEERREVLAHHPDANCAPFSNWFADAEV
jgi:hypothetical protein